MKATLVCVILCLVASQPASAASFQGLGDLPGGATSSFARRVSADGKVVVGESNSEHSDLFDDGPEAFRWTAGTGIVGLGVIGPIVFDHEQSSSASGVSQDGSLVVGLYSDDHPDATPFRWTASTGMVDAGLPARTQVTDLSDNGEVIVGDLPTPAGNRAMRWTSTTGAVALPDFPGSTGSTTATGVSADGSVVVGYLQEGSGAPFYWTESAGVVPLAIPAGAVRAFAKGVSADGTTIVGSAYYGNRNEAVVWKVGGGLNVLDDFGGTNDEALAASADGSVVVGHADPLLGFDSGAFIWDAQHGTRSIYDVLKSAGINMNGWRLETATDVSADGLTIVGVGVNPAGFPEAWIATVPEPSSILLGLIGLLALARVSRASRRT
jgi:probable HAF family extracellular repeat protein